MPVDVVWTTVFADGPNGGNPCPVVLGAEYEPDDELLARAADFGAETVFVLPAEDADVRYRYFVPRHEMEMCVHATVAATVLLGARGRFAASPARVATPLGELRVEWDAATGRAVVPQFPPTYRPELPAADRDRLAGALRLPAAALGVVRAVSTARPKLMIELGDEATLDALDPDHELLWTLCDDLDVTGCYPYTQHAGGADVAARQFPRRAGYPEDPATGVAAAALAAHLADPAGPERQRWRIAQGRAMGRPSLLDAEADVLAGAVVATRVGGLMRVTAPPARPL